MIGKHTPATFVPASDKQKGFAAKLAAEVSELNAKLGIEVDTLDVETLSKREASEAIDWMLNKILPSLRSQVRESEPAPASKEGFYLVDGEVVKVQAALYGTGREYAKVLDAESGRFEYTPGMVSKCNETNRMTLEQAKEYGHLYGRCVMCGRPLTDENSIAAGIGPVCAEKF